MRVDLFDFDLPTELIAQKPAEPRGAARLLGVGSDLADHVVADLPTLLNSGDVLVVNDTKVLPCRLTGIRPGPDGSSGTKVQITLHKPIDDARWLAFARPAKKLHPGDRLIFNDDFEAEVISKRDAGEVEFGFNLDGPNLLAALEAHGVMPLPPYIKRTDAGEASDRDNYQTLFANQPGAVAAPTAGLHFTLNLVEALGARGVKIINLTLHVGAGTFLPVKTDDTDDHIMHGERGTVSPDAADAINTGRAAGGRVVAVGSTAMRLLESAADPSGHIHPFAGETDVFFTPGYRFRTVDMMMTNFHLPRSTLFMLVAAFAGLERMQMAYAHAIASGYRFYSYGDACLLEPNPATWGNVDGQ